MTMARRDDGSAVPARCLMVFGKLPEAGRTKTRLAPLVGPTGAAALYRAFLDDTVELACRVPGANVELWVPRRRGAARTLGRRFTGVELRWQSEGGLGQRLREAFRCAFAGPPRRAMVLGSDHPTLPAGYLRQGFEALEEVDLVLGPSRDGGYYALGLRREAWPAAARLFEDIPWSTPRVLARTRERAREMGLVVMEMPSWYDVDRPEDLDRLLHDVRGDSHTARALAARDPSH